MPTTDVLVVHGVEVTVTCREEAEEYVRVLQARGATTVRLVEERTIEDDGVVHQEREFISIDRLPRRGY